MKIKKNVLIIPLEMFLTVLFFFFLALVLFLYSYKCNTCTICILPHMPLH